MGKTKDVFYINIAGFNIKIRFHESGWTYGKEKFKRRIMAYLKGFLLFKEPEITDGYIDFIKEVYPKTLFAKKEREHFINFYRLNGKNKVTSFYRISIFEFQYILGDILSKLLAGCGGFILHASAVNYGGKAYIFLGESGAGKSTVRRFLAEKYISLTDDTVIVKKEDNRYLLYQTPFFERERQIKKGIVSYPLAKAFFLKKAELFKIEKIRNDDLLLNLLFKQFLMVKQDYSRKQIKYILKFIVKFDNFYYLYFKKDKKLLRQLLEN